MSRCGLPQGCNCGQCGIVKTPCGGEGNRITQRPVETAGFIYRSWQKESTLVSCQVDYQYSL